MVKLDIVPLTDGEVELVQNTLDALSEPDNRRFILEGILSECPELADSFAMVVGLDRQSAFLMNMMKRGFNYVCYQSFDAIYDIFARHPKYNIKTSQLSMGYKWVIKCIERTSNGCSDSVAAWTKLCDILDYIADVAYSRPDEKKLGQMKKRVMRSMSADDITTVVESWATVLENEITVADILANLLQKEKKIIRKFHEHNIDVFKQSVIILRMIGKVLKQLDDIEMLIPYLKKLGAKHVEMTVGPRLLAMMKPIVVTTLGKALGFAFTDAMKQSWNKVLSFIIGIMVEVARNTGNETTKTADDVSDGEAELTNEIVDITQRTWREVSVVIDAAVGSFYRDLLSSKPEIRNLFSRSNMKSQANKLVRAIGSTIALLDNQETLVPILEELGRRHVYYNVRPKYFKHLKKAWFNMLKSALALKWTQETQRAWNVAWKFITSIMKSSLEDALLFYIPADPEKVKLKVLINHIDRVQVQNLSFYGDVWFAAYTGDNPSQSQAFQLNNENAAEKQELDAFYDASTNKPKEMAPFGNVRILNSMNTKEIYRHKKERYLRKFKNDDTWYLRGNLRGTFAQMYDLRAFPFDQHKLELTIALEVDDTIAILDEESLFVRLMPFKMDSMAGADWDVYSPSICIKEQSAMSGGSSSGKKYTHAQVTIPISRKWHHHIYETIFPLLLIEIVAYGVYFAEEFPMVERVTVVVTLLLTLFAFKWTVAKSMPPTPYLTLMDYFFNTAYMMLLAHIIGLCVLTIWEFEDSNTIRFVNWLLCGVNFTIWFLIHSYLFYKAKYYFSLYPKTEEYDALGAVAKAALTSPNKKSTKDNASSDNIASNGDKAAVHKSGASKYKVQPVTHEA